MVLKNMFIIKGYYKECGRNYFIKFLKGSCIGREVFIDDEIIVK